MNDYGVAARQISIIGAADTSIIHYSSFTIHFSRYHHFMHVLVNDPIGYGIFIENMLDAAA